jgi:serine/threonine protein kinase
MKVPEASLGSLTFLAEGGFGQVFRVGNYTLPGDQTPLAYKKFTVDQDQQAESATAAVEFREQMNPADRAGLDERSTWPRALVTGANGAVCGLLMPFIPGEFFFTAPDGSGQLVSQPREMSWLVSSDNQRTAAGVDFDDVPRTDRLVLLAQLVYAIGRLHKHGWVFGDLSFSNAVFALDPPRMMLLDCDGAAALNDPTRKQSSTPFWDPPECPIQPPPGGRQQDRQDAVTDVYKLGLAILRCMSPGKGAASSRNVARLGHELDAEGTDLVTRALSTDRRLRPPARDIYDYLRRTALGRVVLPEIAMARLTTPCRVRGMDARIEWRIDHADQVEIHSGNGDVQPVPLSANPLGYTFQPSVSGPVRIEARNRFGSARVDLGELTLYDLPQFQLSMSNLPAVYVPELSAFCPPSLAATMAGRPPSPVGADIVAIPSLSTPELLAGLFPVSSHTALPPVGVVANQASNSLTAVINDEQREFREILRDRFQKELVRLAQYGGSGP